MPEARFCPNCGSLRVEPDTSNRAETAFSGGNPNRWKCRECGYNGMMPTGDPDEDDEDQNVEEMDFEPGEKYSREETEFGKAYLKYLVYITLPVLLGYLVYLRLI